MTDRLPLRVVKVGGSLFGFAPLPQSLRRWLAAQAPAQNILIAGGGALADAVRHADDCFQLGDAAAHDLAVRAMSVSARVLATILPEATLVEDVRDAVCGSRLAGCGLRDAACGLPASGRSDGQGATGVSPVQGATAGLSGSTQSSVPSLALRASIEGPSATDTRHNAGAPIILDVESFLRDVEPAMPGEALPRNWGVTSDSIAARVAVALDADELVLLKSRLPSGTLDALVAGRYVDRYFPRAVRPLGSVRCVDLRTATFPQTAIVTKPIT